MNAQPIPKGYKKSDVGVIPEEWNLIKLGEASFITKLAGFEYSKHFNSYKDEGEIIVVRGTNITHNRLELYDVRTIPKSVSDTLPRSKLQKGDLVFAYVGTIGPVWLVDQDGKYHLGPNTAKIVCGEILDSKYLFHYFNSHLIKREIDLQTSVGAQPSLSMTKIRNFRVICPPLPEQRAIAAALSDVDGLLSALDALIAKKRAVKTAAMQQLLTGKTHLPGFSGEWKKVVLGNHVKFLKTGSYSRAQLTNNDPIKYLHYGDIHAANNVWLDAKVTSMPRVSQERASRLDFLQVGDVIFVDASEDLDGVGKSLEITGVPEEGVVSGLHTIAARFDKSVLADGFKGYLQFIPDFRHQLLRLAAGTKVYATQRSHIASIELELPDVKEQGAIAAVLSDIDAEIAALEARREKVRQIKQGMMQILLTGKVRLVGNSRSTETAIKVNEQ